jgi:hypothetical protein
MHPLASGDWIASMTGHLSVVTISTVRAIRHESRSAVHCIVRNSLVSISLEEKQAVKVKDHFDDEITTLAARCWVRSRARFHRWSVHC